MTTTLAGPGEIVVGRLAELGVSCELVDVHEAPQVTRVSLRPTGSARMIEFTRLRRADDLAAALESPSVRIEAPVPGTGLVGVEFARRDRRNVGLDDLPAAEFPLRVPIGLEVDGSPAWLPLTEAPHCLIAGQSGAGKSSILHVIVAQALRSHSPARLNLVLIDVKRVELSVWEDAPHLAAPIAEDAQTAIRQLRGVVGCMENRYQSLRALGARDISAANEVLAREGAEPIAYVVVVVDELAELMMTSRGEVESLLVRLSQKGRAAGVHLLVATQYPKSECVTGLLRVNLPTKVALSVPDQVASRLIIGKNGAEALLGRGDGLLSLGGLPPQRFQSAYVTDEEIQNTIRRWRV